MPTEKTAVPAKNRLIPSLKALGEVTTARVRITMCRISAIYERFLRNQIVKIRKVIVS